MDNVFEPLPLDRLYDLLQWLDGGEMTVPFMSLPKA